MYKCVYDKINITNSRFDRYWAEPENKLNKNMY